MNLPAPMDKELLLELIDDIRAHVADDDSMEGFLEYSLPDEDAPEGTYAMVRASYRIGNRQGQGGLRVFRRGSEG